MKWTSLAACAATLLVAAVPLAQNPLDLSGRWRLVQPTAAELAKDTLKVNPADELAITQTPLTLVIVHPSNPGTHPEAGVFTFGAGGTTAGDPRGAFLPAETRWGVSYVGTDLMISQSLTTPPDERGVRITIARGSMWRLEGSDRLAIEFGERRTGERPKLATRVYAKLTAPIAPSVAPPAAVP